MYRLATSPTCDFASPRQRTTERVPHPLLRIVITDDQRSSDTDILPHSNIQGHPRSMPARETGYIVQQRDQRGTLLPMVKLRGCVILAPDTDGHRSDNRTALSAYGRPCTGVSIWPEHHRDQVVFCGSCHPDSLYHYGQSSGRAAVSA